MAKFIDYYKILGVPKDTPQENIKTAYKKRTKQFHPDLHPDDPKAKAKFQLLNEAYDVLSDPDKRARYDRYGEQWNKVGGGFGGFGGNAGGHSGANGNPFGDFEFNMCSGGFSDFFSELFGNLGRRQGARGGAGGFGFSGTESAADAEASLDIDMYQALLGGEVIIDVAGSKLKLKIKPGTQPGTKMRLKGKGNVGFNGKASDLILTLNVVLPTNLSDKQKELLDQMRRS